MLDVIHADAKKDFTRTEFMHIYRRNYNSPAILSNISLIDNGNGTRLQSGTFYGSQPWIGSRAYQDDLTFLSIMPSLNWQISDNLVMDISLSKTDSDFTRDNPYVLYYVSEGTLTYKNDGIIPTVNHSNLDRYDDYAWQSMRFGHKERQTETTGFHADFEWGEDADSNGFKFGLSSDEMATRQQEFSATDLDAHLAANGLSQIQNNMADYLNPLTIGNSIDNYQGVPQFGGLNWDKYKKAINYNAIDSVESSSTHIKEKVFAVYLEASASRSLTRANPGDMFPNSKWNGSGIDAVSAGNPKLSPFESTNLDIGGEWYFSELGYVGVTYYTKDITGFTKSATIAENFNDLGEWGIDITDLSQTQRDQLAICDPNCTVSVNSKENTKGVSTLTGFEVIWVQPLDFIIEGLGFNASANKINDDSPEGAEITGISDSHNVTIYYENEDFQTHITYYKQNGASNSSLGAQRLLDATERKLI